MFLKKKKRVNIKETKEHYMLRRNLSDILLKKFKYKLRTVSLDSIRNCSDTNDGYHIFVEIFSSLSDECFPKKKIKLNPSKVQ